MSSCCRISACAGVTDHINNPDGNYRFETIVNVGAGNSSPTSALPPIVLCPQNGVCSFQVPSSDPDGDPVSFRLSTAAEAGAGYFTQPGPPNATNAASISSTGTYTWNTTGAQLHSYTGCTGITLYSTQVMIEDKTSTGTVKSKSPVDFLIQLVLQVGGPPVFNHPPSPACGSTLGVKAGNNLSFAVQASDTDSGQTVTLNVGGLPPGATMTPGLPSSGNPVSSTFSWTPTVAQVGNYVMTFSATDNTGQQALCSVTVDVSMEVCNDGIDNDGDGLVDCADPDCSGAPNCQPAVEDCTNGADDDGDGLVDCADPDCSGAPNCQPQVEDCANGVDDDGDGLVDCADPDCASYPGCAPPSNKCPLSHGYWKNHVSSWPVTSLTLGSQTYNQTELLNLLKAPSKGDASLILAHQLIAANLNIANGSNSAPVASTIASADSTLAGFTGKLPYKVKTSTATGSTMVSDAGVLDSYNNGQLTPNCMP